jgi:hypothetical protein
MGIAEVGWTARPRRGPQVRPTNGVFNRVSMALRATKVDEARAGRGRFSPPLRVFLKGAVVDIAQPK